MTPRLSLRIGTRGSRLALAQAHQVRDALAARDAALAAPGATEIVVIKTTGDRVQDRPLADLGGKGLFSREIDEAMLSGRIDIAVHSVKDLPTWLPDGIGLICVPPRADPRDAFLSPRAADLAALPAGAVVGTASLRRRAQVLARRPDLAVTSLRGNVETRLRKLADGAVDATLLAVAGLARLGLADAVTAVFDPDDMLPAVGQGAIGVTCRPDDRAACEALAPLHDTASGACVAAERALLAALDGSCRTPIGALAEIDAAGRMVLRALVATPDGRRVLTARREGAAADGEDMGRDAGAELRGRAGPEFDEIWT